MSGKKWALADIPAIEELESALQDGEPFDSDDSWRDQIRATLELLKEKRRLIRETLALIESVRP
ncbi:hypothetical protein [Cohnella sp. GCM10027633]|uniref:hypothetical protein n=1 Tax=unclassified Cohnella TaxID=2636738 RepID=UPI00363EF9B2